MKFTATHRLALMMLVACGVLMALVLLPIKQYLEWFLSWVQDLGPWGPVIVGAAYVPACILFIPGSLLTLGAGFLFGVVKGTIAVSLGSVAGASAAFWLGRTLLRQFIEEKVAQNPKFRAIDQAVAQQGAKIVLLTRLSPAFPFNLLNYAFGLTNIRFRDYLWASWIGMLPGTILYIYLGSLAKSLTDLVQGKLETSYAQQALFVVGLIATVAVTVFVTRIARRALYNAIDEHPLTSPDSPPAEPVKSSP